MSEPELITIIEGPTPSFRPNPLLWLQSIHNGPLGMDIVTCDLRTGNGDDIMERCYQAWEENRPVRLDFPDRMRMRQGLSGSGAECGEAVSLQGVRRGSDGSARSASPGGAAHPRATGAEAGAKPGDLVGGRDRDQERAVVPA